MHSTVFLSLLPVTDSFHPRFQTRSSFATFSCFPVEILSFDVKLYVLYWYVLTSLWGRSQQA